MKNNQDHQITRQLRGLRDNPNLRATRTFRRTPSDLRHYERHRARINSTKQRDKSMLESIKLYMEYLNTQNCGFHRTQEEVNQDFQAFLNYKKMLPDLPIGTIPGNKLAQHKTGRMTTYWAKTEFSPEEKEALIREDLDDFILNNEFSAIRTLFPDSLSSMEDMKYMKDYINEETKEE